MQLGVPQLQAPGVVFEDAGLEIIHYGCGLAGLSTVQTLVAYEIGLALQRGDGALSMKQTYGCALFVHASQFPFRGGCHACARA